MVHFFVHLFNFLAEIFYFGYNVSKVGYNVFKVKSSDITFSKFECNVFVSRIALSIFSRLGPFPACFSMKYITVVVQSQANGVTSNTPVTHASERSPALANCTNTRMDCVDYLIRVEVPPKSTLLVHCRKLAVKYIRLQQN